MSVSEAISNIEKLGHGSSKYSEGKK
jgi:hypothetical protein